MDGQRSVYGLFKESQITRVAEQLFTFTNVYMYCYHPEIRMKSGLVGLPGLSEFEVRTYLKILLQNLEFLNSYFKWNAAFFFNVFSFFNISICIIFKYDINLCADALIYYWNGSKKPPRLYTLAHLHWSVCLGDITNIERCKTSWNNTKAWLTADVTLLLAVTTVCDSDNSRYNRSLRHQKTSNSVQFKSHRRKDDSSDQATVTNLLNFGENVAIIAFVFCI